MFNGTKWFLYFSLEIMGWMAFDQAPDLLANGKETYLMELTEQSKLAFATVAHLPWLFLLTKQMTVWSKTFRTFRKWLRMQLQLQMVR